MTELLFTDPTQWFDNGGQDNVAPAAWTGTDYVFSSTYPSLPITYSLNVWTGDTFSCTVSWSGAPAPAVASAAIQLYVNAVILTELDVSTPNGSAEVSYTFDRDFDPFVDGNVALDVGFAGSGETASKFAVTLSPLAVSPPPPPEKFMIELRTSKDGAHNWGFWRQHDMGAQGNFKDRPVFRRLGFGRRIVMHIRASGDRGRDLVACSVDMEPF